jgi:hypothetical protein
MQASILGPVLYAIFVAQLFNIEYLFAFADNKLVPRIGSTRNNLIEDMEKSLEAISEWIKQPD